MASEIMQHLDKKNSRKHDRPTVPVSVRNSMAVSSLALSKGISKEKLIENILERDPEMKKQFDEMDDEPDTSVFALSEDAITGLKKKTRR